MAGKKDIVEQALKLIMGAGEEAVPKAIRAYHVSPHDFDVFKPSEFRGSTFFSSTPERARRGAEAGRNEMVMETSTELPPVNWRTYEVEIDPSRIKGLSLTPSENKWFEALPGKIVGDDALKEATKGIPQGMYWDDFYDETPISEGVYEYTKKASPPSMSYEEAINKNRDIYRQQWPHYAGTATDEKSSASRLNDQGMGGYLLQDEGGLSFAINDPNSVRIIKKYADGGSIREGYAGKGRVVGDIVDQALKLVAGEGGEEAAKTGIRAYHGSPQKGLNRLSTRYAIETPNAVFAAQNPDVAHTFTVPREYGEPIYVDEFGNDIEPGEVLELNLRPQNPFFVPPEDAQKFIDDTAFQTNLVKEARQKGHDLVVAPDVLEGIGERSKGDVYAVLDDRIISIIRKYGIAGASAMLGYNLMENLDANQAQAATVADKEYQATQPEVRGGMLPPGMEPSGEMTSRIPSASERIYDYVRSVLGGDEATKGQRAETVMNIIDQTPLAVGPMAYDIGRGIAEKVAYADGGAVDPYAEEVASAKKILADKAYNDQSWSDWVGDAAENAVRTARSILPTALGGEGSVGISDIARGAYESGKDAVMFPGDVITGKQALFDENGVPLESAVGRSFNTAATLGGASSVVPRPANSVGLFGGISSRTADKAAIREAMKMESKGASPDEIWDNTGWFRGADRRWRYEIPDIGTTVNSAALQLDLSVPTIQPIKSAKLGDYLQHPKFFAAYPQFRSMDVRTMPGSSSYGGMYYPRSAFNSSAVIDPRIELNENLLSNGSSQRSVLLHEIQHAIQNKEGFAPGTNIAAQSAGRINPAVSRYQEAVKNDPEMRELMSIRSSMDYKNQVNEANDLYEAEYRPRDDKIDASSMSDIEKKAAYDAINKEYDERIKNMFPMIKQVEDLTRKINSKNIPLYMPTKKMLTPIEAYNQYAGETEARNVQSRMNWSEENLRGFRPWETQDFPYINQLFPENDVTWKLGYSSGGAVDDDITDALRIAKDVGGGTTPVMLEDAKGNKYDAQGNLIPPTAPGPAPARTPTPQEVGQRAANDPATFDALMQQYAVPDRDIAQYEATKEAVAAQPYETQQMTHVGEKPRREVTVDMPLFGGEYSLGTAPYDAASGMGTLAQTAYDWKTAPFYAIPLTAPLAAGMDVAEGVATEDPLTASLAIGFGPGGKYAKAAGIGAVNYFMDPSEAEAGPARWFSKAMEVANALPMEKMTGQQALAMLRKGVSPEELRWTGAEAFLPQQKQITKSDLIDYLAKNRVQTNEIIRGGSNKPTNISQITSIDDDILAKYKPDIDSLIAQKDQLSNEQAKLVDPSGNISLDNYGNFQSLRNKIDAINTKIAWRNKIMKEEQAERIGGLAKPTVYGPGSRYGERFYTPGGKGYQETTITIPPNQKTIQEWPVIDIYGNVKARYDSKEAAERVARLSGSTVGEPKTTVLESGYRSSHWPELNTLGHIRTQILEATPEGANRPYKLFNVDEAQSDYAQDVRKYGLREEGSGNATKALNEFTAKMAEEWTQKRAEQLYQSSPELFNDIEEARSGAMRLANQRGATAIAEELGLADEFERLVDADQRYRKGLDPAPYVTSTQQWTDFSIKKALDQAIDSGADYFTFTPGEVHADRYNLARDLSHIEYEPDINGEYSISAIDKNGKAVLDKDMDIDEIEEYFGKEIAKKIKADEGRKIEDRPLRDWRVLENEQIKTKGDAMVDAYNNIYKKRVEKVVKDATGKKITWEVLPAQTANGIVPRLGFRIDDDVKNARFSDFNKGGRVTGSTKYADSDTVSRALALTSEV